MKNGRDEKFLYQEAPLSSILPTKELLEFVNRKLDDGILVGVVIFSGTVPIISEKILFSSFFEVELLNPKIGQKLTCAYRIRNLNYLRG